eukprot:scaffold40285_cov72-Cyclotella_meneghiniana.AAC.2
MAIYILQTRHSTRIKHIPGISKEAARSRGIATTSYFRMESILAVSQLVICHGILHAKSRKARSTESIFHVDTAMDIDGIVIAFCCWSCALQSTV